MYIFLQNQLSPLAVYFPGLFPEKCHKEEEELLSKERISKTIPKPPWVCHALMFCCCPVGEPDCSGNMVCLDGGCCSCEDKLLSRECKETLSPVSVGAIFFC